MLKTVLVIGGGIGGLSAAIGCRQRGIDVDLVEIKDKWTVYGVGIFQSNNALRALDRIGLAAKCVERGGPFPGWKIFDGDGKFLIDSAASNAAAPRYPAVNGIARPLLHQILTEAAVQEGTSVRLATTVQASHDDDKCCHVTFSDGTRGEYDFVIAADGIYSQTRERLGFELRPQATGQTVWRYNLPRPANFQLGQIHYGKCTKVGLMPISQTMIYMFVLTEEARDAQMPPERLAPLMRERIADRNGLIGELRDLIVDSEAVVYRPTETILLSSPWNCGRTMLIGDAAHATTPHLGQGAAMAIEDGVLLAELIDKHAHYQDAFDEFMRRRFERVKCVIDTSNKLAGWEMSEWHGHPDPDANPGLLNHRTTLTLLEDY